jgi:hypothetical protein
MLCLTNAPRSDRWVSEAALIDKAALDPTLMASANRSRQNCRKTRPAAAAKASREAVRFARGFVPQTRLRPFIRHHFISDLILCAVGRSG